MMHPRLAVALAVFAPAIITLWTPWPEAAVAVLAVSLGLAVLILAVRGRP